MRIENTGQPRYMLLASGARTGVRDNSGLSAADYARQYGHQQLVPKLSR